jgi:signal transduction histidine kinase
MTGATPPKPRPRGGLALLTVLVQTIGTTITAQGQATHLDLLGYALLVLSGATLAFRHRFPRGSTVIIAAATVSYHLLPYPHGPTSVALIVAGLSQLRAGRHRLVWGIAALTYAAWVILSGSTGHQALVLATWIVGVGVLVEILMGVGRVGDMMMRKQRRLDEEKRRRQASEERLRIAQELHDVLGHHLSLINVRAGVGRHLMDRQPEQARAALDTIREASSEALREVRSVLDALYPSGEGVLRAPAPGLDRLDDLTVDAGMPVRTEIIGDPRPLPAEIDRAAYRIVQEALTNVRRHAGSGVSATITIDYQPEALVLRVEDDGAPGEPSAEGNGISGMRERATALGGSLTAGPLPLRGWRVSASLPLPVQEVSEVDGAS